MQVSKYFLERPTQDLCATNGRGQPVSLFVHSDKSIGSISTGTHQVLLRLSGPNAVTSKVLTQVVDQAAKMRYYQLLLTPAREGT
jgi:hypothetical protein